MNAASLLKQSFEITSCLTFLQSFIMIDRELMAPALLTHIYRLTGKIRANA